LNYYSNNILSYYYSFINRGSSGDSSGGLLGGLLNSITEGINSLVSSTIDDFNSIYGDISASLNNLNINLTPYSEVSLLQGLLTALLFATDVGTILFLIALACLLIEALFAVYLILLFSFAFMFVAFCIVLFLFAIALVIVFTLIPYLNSLMRRN